jgi:Holliday junction resolvasome RuvABC endonuclease subunit
MKILGLDLSTNTGYALITDGSLDRYGTITAKIDNFNVNNRPETAKEYPFNILNAANEMAAQVITVVLETQPDYIWIENTVRGKNRNTQRALEWIHKAVLEKLIEHNYSSKFSYIDPSQWRKKVGLVLSKEDKKNNSDVTKKKKRGRITRKHLAVNMVNELYNKEFKIKDNDICDAILVAYSSTI